MNERILQIAKQAGLKGQSETAMSPVEEKFVELIVKECMSLVSFYDNSYPNGPSKLIKTYFGVE